MIPPFIQQFRRFSSRPSPRTASWLWPHHVPSVSPMSCPKFSTDFTRLSFSGKPLMGIIHEVRLRPAARNPFYHLRIPLRCKTGNKKLLTSTKSSLSIRPGKQVTITASSRIGTYRIVLLEGPRSCFPPRLCRKPSRSKENITAHFCPPATVLHPSPIALFMIIVYLLTTV